MNAAEPPSAHGAYALIIDLDQPTVGLSAGRYVYAGSAYGPGGIGARVARHLRAAKKPHWHIDRLTAAGRVVDWIAVQDGDECRILAAALTLPGATVPKPGFGSSDCRTCPAHLVRASRGVGTAEIAARLDRS